MTPIAVLFPGQGAQRVGMGKDFYDLSTEARSVFEQTDKILGYELSKVMFLGPEEKLMETAYSQMAIMAMSIAAFEAFKVHLKFRDVDIRYAAGLSLGEYSALCAAGALSFESTLQLLEKRSLYMDQAAKMNKGTMAAIIGLDKQQVIMICREAGIEIANYNSPKQIVVTGQTAKVEASFRMFETAGARSVVPLAVSGAFHSSLMSMAEERFKVDLERTAFQSPRFPVVQNVNGRPVTDPKIINENLSKQITSSVQWVETIERMASEGITEFVEIGPGNVLKGLVRRISRDLNVQNIETTEDIDRLIF